MNHEYKEWKFVQNKSIIIIFRSLKINNKNVRTTLAPEIQIVYD
jgi:hypothetical protein